MLFWNKIFFVLRKLEEAFLVVTKNGKTNTYFLKLTLRNNLKV